MEKEFVASSYSSMNMWETILFFIVSHIMQGMREGKFEIPLDILLVQPSEARIGLKIRSNFLFFRCESPTEEAIKDLAKDVTKAYEALTMLDFPFLTFSGIKVIPAKEKGEYLLRAELKKAA